MIEQSVSAIFLFSGKVLAATAVMNLVFGTTTGFILAQGRSLPFRFFDILISLPLVFPPIALGFFLILLLGRNGLIGKGIHDIFHINIIFTSTGVIMASFIAGFPLMVKSVKSAAMVLDSSMVEASYLQGASKLQTFVYIILPNIKNGVLTGLSLSLGRSLGEVGMTLLLGGNITGKTETLSLAIFNAVFEGNFSKAALLSCFLGGISCLLFLGIQTMEKEYDSMDMFIQKRNWR